MTDVTAVLVEKPDAATSSHSEAKQAKSRATTPKVPKAKADATIKLSSIYAKKAATLNIDATRAAKLVRSKMRSNFDTMCKLSPNIKTSKKAANDGNRWPTHITREAAQFVLAGVPKK